MNVLKLYTSTMEVYQYYNWRRCCRPETLNNMTTESMGNVYNKTHERTESNKGRKRNTVIELWKCDWLHSCKKMSEDSLDLLNLGTLSLVAVQMLVSSR